MFKKVISLALSVVFSLQTCGFAQAGQLNLAGYLGQGGGAPALDRFRPAHLRYFSYEPDSDNFQILLDKADEKDLSDVQVKDKADELMRYFRIGLSLPNDKFWVNLRPDAPEQIIDPALEQTDMGKIMLEADLQLKKDTSSLTSPQTKEGKEYWDKLYKKAGELFGTENIIIPTITRPWIVPGEIIVRQSGNSGSTSLTTSAYIYKAALKVMLEEDYLNNQKTEKLKNQKTNYNFPDPRMKELNKYSTQLIRELIIPQLTKEVNRAKRYAGLRQVYYSLILARWFKQSYQNSGATEPQGKSAPVNENNTLAKLIDSGSLNNLTSREPWSKDTYYQGYKKSFEQGEYNLSETVRTPTGQVIRRYVSGGEVFTSSALKVDDHFDVGNVNRSVYLGDKGVLLNGNSVAIAVSSAITLYEAQHKLKMILEDNVPDGLFHSDTYSTVHTGISNTEDFPSLNEFIDVLLTKKEYWQLTDTIEKKRKIRELIGEMKKSYFLVLVERIFAERKIFNSMMKAIEKRFTVNGGGGNVTDNSGKIINVGEYKIVDKESYVIYSFSTDFNFKAEDGIDDVGMDNKDIVYTKRLVLKAYKNRINGAIEFCNIKLFDVFPQVVEFYYNPFLQMGINVGESVSFDYGQENLPRMSFKDIERLVDSLNKHLLDEGNLLVTGNKSLSDLLKNVMDPVSKSSSALTLEERMTEELNKDIVLNEEKLKLQIAMGNPIDKSNKKLKESLVERIGKDVLANIEEEIRVVSKVLVSTDDPSILNITWINSRFDLIVVPMEIPFSSVKYRIFLWDDSRGVISDFSIENKISVSYADERFFKYYTDSKWSEFGTIIKYVLGISGASSALTLDKAKSEINNILKNINFNIVNGNKDGALMRLKIEGESFEKLYYLLSWILEDSSGIPVESMDRLKRLLNSLKLGILADELKKQGVTATKVQMNLSNINDFREITINNVTLKVEIEFFPIGIKILLKEPNANTKYVEAGSFFLPYEIPYEGFDIMVYHLNNKESFSIEDVKALARKIATSLDISGASSAIVTKGAAPEDIGAVDFRAMDMLIRPAGSFRGLDFSPVALSNSALKAMDLEKDLEGINQMTLGRRRTHPQRLKEYVSACIFKGKIDEKADDFILSMLEVFQLQAEEGIESASQDREAVVLADTRGYALAEN